MHPQVCMMAVTPQAALDLPKHVQAKSRWRVFQSNLAAGEVPDITIGISSSFTVDSLAPMLGTALLEAGIKPRITLGQYDQIFQTCMDHHSQFDGAAPDVLALLWRIEEMLAPEFWRFITGQVGALDEAREKIDELARALAHLRANFKGMIVVSLPPFPQGTPVDLLDVDNPTNAGLFHRAILNYATERLSEAGNIRFIDLDALQRQFGASNCFDSRKWYLYKQPYTEAFLWEMGSLLARVAKANRVAPRKCVVLDADNTLWGGVIGEDGIEGIAIGEDFPGSAYCDLQKYMLYLQSKGVLLGISSKNNEPDLWEVFDRHDGMKLKRDHISAWRIDWQSKIGNIPKIAADLNIGTDSLVFVDDNPFEIGQVCNALPEVACIQLPEEPSAILETLKSARFFDKFEVTKEDANRAKMILSERVRTSLSESMTPEQFSAELGLKVDMSDADSSQLGRIAQLINKTNQFNLTTVRRTQEEVEALHVSPHYGVYSLRVSDKFGDYGLVGVAVVEKTPNRWRIDTFLLSCRVLGRGVESAFLAGLAAEAQAADAKTIEAAFIPSLKNAPSAGFLPAHGFTELSDNRWEIAIETVPANPSFISLSILKI